MQWLGLASSFLTAYCYRCTSRSVRIRVSMRHNSPVQMAEHDAMKKERTDRLAAALVARLAQAWSRDTSSDAEHWSASNPAWGQCAVTALIVQDLLGGHLL